MFSLSSIFINTEYIIGFAFIISLCISTFGGFLLGKFKYRQPKGREHFASEIDWIDNLLEPAFIINNDNNIIRCNTALLNKVHHNTSELDEIAKTNIIDNRMWQGPIHLESAIDQSWYLCLNKINLDRTLVKLVPEHQHIQNLEIKNEPSQQLYMMQEILTNLLHTLHQPIFKIKEQLQKAVNTHNLQLPRSKFLLEHLQLNPESLQSYFDRYGTTEILNQLKQATTDLEELSLDIKPCTPEQIFSRQKFSIKESLVELSQLINNTSVAQSLIKHGLQPIIFIDEIETDIQMFGNKSLFLKSLTALYKLLAQPFHDSHKEDPLIRPSIICNIGYEHNTNKIIITFNEISTYNWLATYRNQITPEQLSHSCKVTLLGVTGLTQLHSAFQMTFTTEQLTKATSALKLYFPTNMALNDNFKKRNNVDFASMRDNPETEEFLLSLSEDFDLTSVKQDKKKITIH